MTTARSWSDLLTTLVGRRDLTAEQTQWAMAEIMRGDASPTRVAAFLVARQQVNRGGGVVDQLLHIVQPFLAVAQFFFHAVIQSGGCDFFNLE